MRNLQFNKCWHGFSVDGRETVTMTRCYSLMKKMLGGLCCLLALKSGAQELSKDTGYNTPSVVGLPKAKVFQFKYELIPHYTMTTTAKQPGFNNSVNDVTNNSRLEARLRFPVYRRRELFIAMGLKYYREEFHFSPQESSSNKFYNTLNDRDLKSLGASLYMIRATKGEKYFLLNANFDLNGDYTNKNYNLTDFLKFSITPLIGWKKSNDLSYAVGVSYNSAFGAPMLYPVASYNKNFNKYWGLETLLPVNVRVRYSPNVHNFFYGTLALNGASYRLDNKVDSVFADFNNLHLHRSELKLTTSLEKEIHDWLWFSLEAGVRHNFKSNITNSRRARKDIILSNRLSDGFLVSASIFIVPPRAMMKRLKQ
jgi:hypothetical protein